jgi:eukaryotic-like serine/threonine-protein kinase
VSGAFTAPVVDADADAEVPWMATSFVVGVPLDQAVRRRGPLSGEALWALTAGLAEALAHVHAAEVIHRDLKPANVMLALDGPRVIDFLALGWTSAPCRRSRSALHPVAGVSPSSA